jgi:hypothetical protein
MNEEQWIWLGSAIRRIEEAQELSLKLLQVAARQGKLEEIGGYAHGRTEKGSAYIILYSYSDYKDHKITRVYQEMFSTLPDYVDVAVPNNTIIDDNPTKSKAKKMGAYKPCKAFTIAVVEGKETQMGKEIRYLNTIYTGRPPITPSGIFNAGQMQSYHNAPAPTEIRAEIDAGYHDLPQSTVPRQPAEYDQLPVSEEDLEEQRSIIETTPTKYPTAEEEADFIASTVGDSYEEVIDVTTTPEGKIVIQEVEPSNGVTLQEAKDIQAEHMRLDQEDYDNGVYEGEDTSPEYTVTKARIHYDRDGGVSAIPVEPEPEPEPAPEPIIIEADSPTLPRVIKANRLNQQLFPQHQMESAPIQPYTYGDGTAMSHSPFVIKLYLAYYNEHNIRPRTAKDLQNWYNSEGMSDWLKEAKNIEWLGEEHDHQERLKMEKTNATQ